MSKCTCFYDLQGDEHLCDYHQGWQDGKEFGRNRETVGIRDACILSMNRSIKRNG